MGQIHPDHRYFRPVPRRGLVRSQQGTCKLTLNVKDGIVEEALVETIGCSGMTHSAAMAAEILPGKTLLECLNTDLVCDAINVAMRKSSSSWSTAAPSPLSPRTACPSAPDWRIWARACVLRWAPCTPPRRKASAIWKWRGLCAQAGSG